MVPERIGRQLHHVWLWIKEPWYVLRWNHRIYGRVQDLKRQLEEKENQLFAERVDCGRRLNELHQTWANAEQANIELRQQLAVKATRSHPVIHGGYYFKDPSTSMEPETGGIAVFTTDSGTAWTVHRTIMVIASDQFDIWVQRGSQKNARFWSKVMDGVNDGSYAAIAHISNLAASLDAGVQ